ncbi:autorepressor SdpR family transcription factor [Patescibacteria group bacterium]|nr:autorepressor SdpR family transcription factor [Patescibacteria group bacterium]
MNALSISLHALSDHSRRRVLHMLQKKDMTAGQIASRFPTLTKPSLSHHFSVLKQANLVTSERKGQKIIYSLNTTVFYELLNNIMEIFGKESVY